MLPPARILAFGRCDLRRGVLLLTSLPRRAIKQFIDFAIRDLREIEVELAHTVKRLWRLQADQVVHVGPEAIPGGNRRHGDSNHDVRRRHLAQGIMCDVSQQVS
jgi:hypothetical protein